MNCRRPACYRELMIMALGIAAATAGAAPILLPAPGQGTASTDTLLLTIGDIKGSYTVPYIQSDGELRFLLEFAPEGPGKARARLMRDGAAVANKSASRDHPRITFPRLEPGEYSLELESLDADGRPVGKATWQRIAVGTIIGAIGDSITEGYHGHGFWQDDLTLRGDMFPPQAVSADGRNFPQYSPTTSSHRPDVNCFQSWMTTLNNLLAAQWGTPVFIANEGWGGITSGGYRHMMRSDAGWQERMKRLQPQLWLIHLGVNDERHAVRAEQYASDMAAIVDTLIEDYGASPDSILICRPCYDYVEGGPETLGIYASLNDELIARRGLSHGPDFLAAYAVDKERWYGADPVHPNIEGMEYMARLWSEAIIAAHPRGVDR